MYDTRTTLLTQQKKREPKLLLLPSFLLAFVLFVTLVGFYKMQHEPLADVEEQVGVEDAKALAGRFDKLKPDTVSCFGGDPPVINDVCPNCNGKNGKSCFTGEMPQRIKRYEESTSFFRDDGVCTKDGERWLCAEDNFQPPSSRTQYPKFDANPAFDLVCTGGDSKTIYEKYIDAAAAKCEEFFIPSTVDPESRVYTEINELFKGFGDSCKAHLDSGSKPAFWSGDIALSRLARQSGFSTLEGTVLGELMDVKLSFDLLGGREDGCIGKFWTAISAQFTYSMTADTVTVVLSAMRMGSTYFKTELGRTMLNDKLKNTKFVFATNECRCPRPRNEDKCIDTHVKDPAKCAFLKGPDGKQLEVTCAHTTHKEEDINKCLAQYLCKTPKIFIKNRFSIESGGKPSQEYVNPTSGAVYYDNFDDRGVTTRRVWTEFCAGLGAGATVVAGQEIPAESDAIYNPAL